MVRNTTQKASSGASGRVGWGAGYLLYARLPPSEIKPPSITKLPKAELRLPVHTIIAGAGEECNPDASNNRAALPTDGLATLAAVLAHGISSQELLLSDDDTAA